MAIVENDSVEIHPKGTDTVMQIQKSLSRMEMLAAAAQRNKYAPVQITKPIVEMNRNGT